MLGRKILAASLVAVVVTAAAWMIAIVLLHAIAGVQFALETMDELMLLLLMCGLVVGIPTGIVMMCDKINDLRGGRQRASEMFYARLDTTARLTGDGERAAILGFVQQHTIAYRTQTFCVHILSWLLSWVEALFPLLPYRSKEVVNAERADAWQDPEAYYFLEDPSFRLWQRLKAVVCLNRNGVSFWRRREWAFRLLRNCPDMLAADPFAPMVPQ